MDGLAVLEWCRARPGATEELPFGPDTLVFKVGGRIFAITEARPDPTTVSLKCDPDRAELMRAQHGAVTPGYHLNKRHWNTVRLDGSLPPDLVEELLDHSYMLILDGLPRSARSALRAQAALLRGRELLERAAFRTGDFDAAEAELATARDIAEAAGDQATLAGALDQLGTVRHWRNLESRRPDGGGRAGADHAAVDEELDLVEGALALRRRLGDDAGIAESAFHAGLVHQLFTGRWDLAEELFQEAHTLAGASGDPLLRSEVHRHLGAVRWHARDFDGALRELTISLELRESGGMTDRVPSALIAMGQVGLDAGRRSEGIDHLRRGVEMAERIGLRELLVAPARRALAEALAAEEEA
ncbi:MAG TPA: MmcQ/YjbR family DNA-binding protein [Candidatus Dormibacteraeota bacterium]